MGHHYNIINLQNYSDKRDMEKGSKNQFCPYYQEFMIFHFKLCKYEYLENLIVVIMICSSVHYTAKIIVRFMISTVKWPAIIKYQ